MLSTSRPLRARWLGHCSPYAKDVVIAGADLADVRVLVFPDLDACRTIAPDLAAATPADLVADARHVVLQATAADVADRIAVGRDEEARAGVAVGRAGGRHNRGQGHRRAAGAVLLDRLEDAAQLGHESVRRA